jgi:hypothetical protein
VTTADSDPFDGFETPAAQQGGIVRRGRYMLPNRDGSPRGRGWMRVSNLVAAYSDQFALRMWEIEHALRGMAIAQETGHIDLLTWVARWDAMTSQERKHDVEELLERLKAVTGADAGAKHGNQRHAAVEGVLPAARQDAGTRRHLSLYQDAMDRHQLIEQDGCQERIILCEALEVCGRIDNIMWDQVHGCFRIADLKTQRRFWSWLEIKAQLACYAHADAMWDETAGEWVDMPRMVAQDRALVLWMPRETDDGEPRVDVYEVDIEAGWKTARRAYEVIRDRSLAKSVKPGAWLRPGPVVSAHARWAARFAAVDSLAEGSRLVAEARAAGVWTAELAECARAARGRLTLTRNMVS